MPMEIKVGDILRLGDAFISSETKKETFSIDWDLNNFPNLKQERYYSPIVTGGPKCQHQWKLYVEPTKNNSNDGVNYVTVGLHLHKSGDGKPVEASFQHSLIDSNRKVLSTLLSTDPQKFTAESKLPTEFASWGWNTFVKRSDVLDAAKGFLTDGHILKINCQIIIDMKLEKKEEETKRIVESDGVRVNKMKLYLSSGQFSDVSIKTPTHSFPASKILLSASSPVFEAMFTSEMKEATENVVEIIEFSDEVVEGMLEFVYTGQTDLMRKHAADLLKIADKYELTDMKGKCEEILLKKLRIENAAEMLISSHLYSPTTLKPKIISFINRCKKQVQSTDGYKWIKTSYPQIFLELYEALE